MPVYQAIILAIVQGFTEFLPVSSSAHLFLVPWILGWPDQGLDFDIALHIGTLFAVLSFFFKDWLQILAQALGVNYGNDPDLKRSPRLLWYLVAASVPAGLVGLKFKDSIETSLRNPFIMGTMLILVGILLWVAERYGWREKNIGEVTLTDTLLIGAQAGTTPFYTAVYEVLDGNEANPRIKLFETFGTSVEALKAGDVDSVLTDMTAGQGYVAASDGKLKLVGDPLGTEDFGFIFPKGSAWEGPINAAIAAMKADGTFDALNKKWFLDYKMN